MSVKDILMFIRQKFFLFLFLFLALSVSAKEHKGKKKHSVKQESHEKVEDCVSTDSLRHLLDSVNHETQSLINKNKSLNNSNDAIRKENKRIEKQLHDLTEEKKGDGNVLIDLLYVLLFAAIIVGFFFLIRRKNHEITLLKNQIKKLKEEINEMKKKMIVTSSKNTNPQNAQTSTPQDSMAIRNPKSNSAEINSEVTKPSIIDKSFSNTFLCSNSHKKNAHKFYIVYGSSIGKSHLGNNTPCQDNHACGNIDDDWGIAVICDGAGSAENSQLGSQFVSEQAYSMFKDVISKGEFYRKKRLPDDDEWNTIVNSIIKQIQVKLKNLAIEKNIDNASLACTLIVVVYTPYGLLVSHIGDGRAGYLNKQGEWKSIIKPHKGEESNQTIFLTSKELFDERLLMSDVPVPENRVIDDVPMAFTLMSDGCENSAFSCSKFDNETQTWTDPNSPYSNFFNPLMQQLTGMAKAKVSLEDANKKWRDFIESGVPKLAEESDDKTLILAILAD